MDKWHPLPTELAHLAAAEHKQAIKRIVNDLVAAANAADPTWMARELCLVMEGAYVTRQVTGDLQSINIARRVAELIISSYLGEADRGPAGGSRV